MWDAENMECFKPDKFFAIAESHPLAGMLAEVECVWELLLSIKPTIRQIIKPNVSEILKKGSLVTEPVALFDGQTVFGVSFRLDGADGRFVCWKDGEALPGAALILPGAFLADDRIEIGPGVLVETGAMIKGPTVLGQGTEVRQGAYVRGSVLAVADCVIGHATEAKNTLLFQGAKAGHFAYLGDSVLGQDVNLGAGTKLANLKMLGSPFRFVADGQTQEVNLRKFGAIMGDRVETGCNSVTSPGVLIAPGCKILPNVTVKSGYYPTNTLIRAK
ncbi:MAG: glucose-1-phosphate thymidylyltransferase [Deltaproteobacteria bacterium]|jgi:bifunctional N-acetylglucosamine-1-phosphate-uridyltransferase/glucosamine-1-phosphate-acetyltransferase GlmU-like protein|nr:glucose-1-phosphate thymidylyltransferase [Deltaproteobacteria bacterium]